MIGTWTVVGIRHLTHNQVVAGSSPAGPGMKALEMTKKGLAKPIEVFKKGIG